jgi:dihydrolipoamide dehydrogenase
LEYPYLAFFKSKKIKINKSEEKMSGKNYDLIVIGAGPGGYVSAIYGAKQGLKTAIIEKNSSLGGTCLNIGCIPTKTLVETANTLRKIKNAKDFGVKVESHSFDFKTVMKRKERVVSRLTKGISFLMKQNKIEVIKGTASFVSENKIAVNNEEYNFKNAIIATGSTSASLPHIKPDEKFIVTSTKALSFETVPENLVIIGGGVIGVEFASIYASFGAKVTIIELTDQLLPGMDKDVASELEKSLKKSKIKVFTSSKVTKAANNKVTFETSGKLTEIDANVVLLSVGRKPYIENLKTEKANIKTDKGHIVVDKNLQTNVKGIYAIGDVIDTPKLAHLASREGMKAVNHITGIEDNEDLSAACPGVVYSYPEIATVGLTKEQAQRKGINAEEFSFPLTANSKAYVEGIKSGFVKAVIEKETKKLIGLHIVGGKASDLISEGTVAIAKGLTVNELGNIIHPHPTISESLMEVFHIATGHAIHI